MSARKTTIPNLTSDSPLHQAAIKAGDEHFHSYAYNVEDRFKDKSQEEIRQTLRDTAFPFAVLFEEWVGSFTLSSGMRNANAFNAKEIFYLGIKHIDKRGMLGCYHYNPIQWLPTVDALLELKDRYVFVGVDNIAGAVSMHPFQWPDNTLMIFGTEGTGLTPTLQRMCDAMVYIPQHGSIRSLNAAVASGIAMYDWITKFRSKR
jgi:tRNA G18 (ribose-2'-O)-methylase SpoU